MIEVGTGRGPARAYVHEAAGETTGTLLLTHGAGGGIGASDLAAVTETLPPRGWRVVLVEMPWRVAGKKVAPPPARLDESWREIVPRLREQGALPGRLVMGGRSAGARVACRLAGELGADAVLCLSFPLVPPGKGPEKSRIGELVRPLEHGLPVHVVQGAKDPFGGPDAVRAALADAGGDEVVAGSGGGAAAAGRGDVVVDEVPGTHSFSGAGAAAVATSVAERLDLLFP